MRLPLLLLFVLSCGLTTPARPPNIVFILADDLGYGELGCYGQEKIRTPRLDALATEGLRFTRHYSGSPVCAPSRCVLLTGKHPGHAFIRNNGEVKPEGQRPIPAEEVTLAERLKSLGYTTGCFGKWGLGYPGSEGDPLQQGFDRFFGYNCQRHAHSYYPGYLWDDDQRIDLDNHPPVPGHAKMPKSVDDPAAYERFKGSDYASDRIHAAALDFIRDHYERPFFLYYPTLIPHLALHVPDEDLAPYHALGWDDPPDSARYTPHFTPRAAYAAMITRLDTYVGRILDLLDELDLADDTLVVFTSDNGPTHLGPLAEFFDSARGLRGLKGSSYEGGLRVPCLVRWPGRVAPDTTTDFITGFEDWLPTLVEAGRGRVASEESDGLSMVPTLTGTAQQRPWLYREFQGYGGQQALWRGTWKGVRTHLMKPGSRPEQAIALYDLSTDPGETRNLAADHPQRVAEFHAIMQAQHRPSPEFPIRVLDEEFDR